MMQKPRRLIRAGLKVVLLVLTPGLAAAQAQAPSAADRAQMARVLGQAEDKGAGLDANIVAVLGQPSGGIPNAADLNPRAAAIATKLRCPVCQGVSIADSPSGMATNMREQVRDLVSRGYSEEQILSYFERSYGEFVRLEPPAQGLNMLLWLMPGAVLLGGGLFVYSMARRRPVVVAAPGAAPAEPSAVPGPPADPALEKYLEKVRRDSGAH